MQSLRLFAFLLIVTLFCSCENPFDTDEISGDQRTLAGTVRLEGRDSHKGILIYLNGIQEHTFTDKDGHFTLTLPPKAVLNSQGISDGVYNLYCFALTFRGRVLSVILQDGQFVFGEANITNGGRINDQLLTQLYRADITVIPEWAQVTATESHPSRPAQAKIPVTVKTEIFSREGYVNVVVPNGNTGLMGGILMKHRKTEAITILTLQDGPDKPLYAAVGVSGQMWGFHFDLAEYSELPEGYYDLYPFFLQDEENTPIEVIETALDFELYTLSEKHLDLLKVLNVPQFYFSKSGGEL
jgi:hypothetical protein